MLLTQTQKQWLADRFKQDVRFDEPMARHTSLRVGGPADAYVEPRRASDLAALVQWMRRNKIPCLTVGNGTNLLVLDGGVRGIVVSLKHCCRDTRLERDENGSACISAGAGISLPALCRYAVRNGVAGLDFALGIPGTLGGAMVMNAGTGRGCMGDVVDAVTVLTAEAGIERLSKKSLLFGYRHTAWLRGPHGAPSPLSTVLEITLRLWLGDKTALKTEADAVLQARAGTQPLHQWSAGSFFKNPPDGPTAGELIDRAGLKGTRVGDAQISKQHANFVVNKGRATAAEILKLKELIQSQILNVYQVALEPEVKIVGT